MSFFSRKASHFSASPSSSGQAVHPSGVSESVDVEMGVARLVGPGLVSGAGFQRPINRF